jgi:hypothetical protein
MHIFIAVPKGRICAFYQFFSCLMILFCVVCRWFRDQIGQLRPVTQSARVTPSQDVLHIRHLSPEDAGRWVCRVSNQFGEQRLETQLTVTAQLSAHVQPQLQVLQAQIVRLMFIIEKYRDVR